MTSSMRAPLKTAAAAFAGLGLCACVNLTPDMVYPIGSAVTVDTALVANLKGSPESGISTAKSGDLLLRQPVHNTAVYVLENDVAPLGNISLSVQKRELNLRKGERFYAALNIGSKQELVACSLGRPAVVIPRLNPDAFGSSKICFELESLGGSVDMSALDLEQDAYLSDRFFFVVDGATFAEEAGPYQKLARWDPQFVYMVTPAAQLRRAPELDIATDPVPEVALRYIYSSAGAQLERVYVIGDRPLDTIGDPIKVDLAADFPKIVERGGARIELLGIAEGVLAYRVLAGFETANTFIMDLPE